MGLLERARKYREALRTEDASVTSAENPEVLAEEDSWEDDDTPNDRNP